MAAISALLALRRNQTALIRTALRFLGPEFPEIRGGEGGQNNPHFAPPGLCDTLRDEAVRLRRDVAYEIKLRKMTG